MPKTPPSALRKPRPASAMLRSRTASTKVVGDVPVGDIKPGKKRKNVTGFKASLGDATSTRRTRQRVDENKTRLLNHEKNAVTRKPVTATKTVTKSTISKAATSTSSRLSSRAKSSIPAAGAKPKRRLTPQELRERLSETRATLKETQSKADENVCELEELRKQLTELSGQSETLEEDLREERKINSELEDNLANIIFERETKQVKIDELQTTIEQQSSEKDELLASIEAGTQTVCRLQEALAIANTSIMSEKAVCANQAKMIVTAREEISAHVARIAELEKSSREDELKRRELHNMVQELKGNIRVYCRVRPSTEDSIACSFPDGTDDTTIVIQGRESTTFDGSSSSRRTHDFSFDRTFRPQNTQENVWAEIKQLCISAIDGYKVTLFAYGQTGSGKTYTMEGPPSADNDTCEGMIPRAVRQVFQRINTLSSKDWSFSVTAMVLEIYNERIRDLSNPITNVTTTGNNVDHKIIHRDGNTEITQIEPVEVTCAASVLSLLQRSSENRSSGKTKMNEHSSRSHSVFQLTIRGENNVTKHKTLGILNFIDLAGSERLKKSEAEGERLKETQNINKSLSCLGDVISSLASQKKHIPYRNSKLTYLLQNCFGGDSKCLMFVCISPEAEHQQESLCSLRFAAKVNACQIGTAQRNVNVSL